MQRLRRPRSNVMHCMLRVSLFLTFLALAQSPLTGSAQTPPTNITSSDFNTTVVPPTGASTTTAIRGGTLSPNNANLFHSFGEFSIGQNALAEFQNVTADGTAPLVSNPASVSNVIARVTGGNPSSIFGAIDTNSGFPSANLFLINPRGIVFGPGASLEVGGAVHFSTADYLRLGTGNEFFYTDLAGNSTLSSAPVTAFGFLGASPVGTQAIELTGSANLTMAANQDIALVGRDTINGVESIPGISLTHARVTSPGGQISLVSVGTPLDPATGGEVSAIDFNPASASSGHGFASLGEIRMTGNSQLSVGNSSGSTVGEILIRGGRLAMENGPRLIARTTDNNISPGLIDIHVTGAMTLTGNGTAIDTSTSSNAIMPAGDIHILADSLTVTDGAQINATNWSNNSLQPRGGNIDITADTVLVTGVFHHPDSGSLLQSGIFSEAKDGVRSGAGQIRITADELSVLDGAAIDTRTEGLGRAGDIEISSTRALVSGANSLGPSTISSRSTFDTQQSGPQAGGDGGTIRIRTTSLDMRDGGQLNTSTETAGNGGIIDVVADSIAINGGRGVTRSGITARSELGGSSGSNGGNVSLTANTLSVTAGGAIELGTSGGGSGGQLSVDAGEITITTGGIIASESRGNGTAGSLSLSAQSFTMTDAGSRLSIRTSGPGNGGAITLNAEDAFLGPGSTIDSRTSSTFTRADPTMQATGGDVNVLVTNNLSLHGARITASSSGISSMAAGNAGTINVSAGHVRLANAAEISSSTTLSSGAGGTISVVGAGPTGSVLINGGALRASTDGSGNAGTITVGGNTVTVSGAASSIDSSTTGTGNAGSILVHAGEVNLQNGGTISSASVDQAAGNAGFITINTTGRFHSSGGQVVTSAGNGQGGDITIQAEEIQLDNGARIAASTTGSLDAGNILLEAGDRIMLRDSTVTTTASQASGGSITLQAPNLIRLRNGQITSSVQGGLGTSGGDIMIDPLVVLLQHNSQILAQAIQGNGGNITIVAGVLIVDGTSQIDASSQLGISGEVSLRAPLRNMAGVITPLPQSFIGQANLYGQRCAAQKGGQFSSFVQGTREGLPVQPGDFIPSPLLSGFSPLSSEQPDTSESPNLAVTPQGMHQGGWSSSTPLVLFSGCRS